MTARGSRIKRVCRPSNRPGSVSHCTLKVPHTHTLHNQRPSVSRGVIMSPVCPLKFPAGCPSGDLRRIHSAQFYSFIIVVLFIILTLPSAGRVFSSSRYSRHPIFDFFFSGYPLAIPTGVFSQERKKRKKKGKKRGKTNSHRRERDGVYWVWEGWGRREFGVNWEGGGYWTEEGGGKGGCRS